MTPVNHETLNLAPPRPPFGGAKQGRVGRHAHLRTRRRRSSACVVDVLIRYIAPLEG